MKGFGRRARFVVIAAVWALVMWRPELAVGPVTGDLLVQRGIAAVLYVYSVLLVGGFGRRAVQTWILLEAVVTLALHGVTVGGVVLVVLAVLAGLRFVTDAVWRAQDYEKSRSK